MKVFRFEGVVTALSSISHNGGQSFGISSKLRREKFVQADGSVEEIPVLSGNGIRGLLRDRGMLHMCRVLGYGVDDESGQVRGLSLPAFHFLFSGGALTDSGKGLDLQRARFLREQIPLVGVFGGAVGNMIMPGRLKCGKMIPICAETAHLLPDTGQPAKPQSIWEYLQEEMYTRKDDAKNEHLRPLLAPAPVGLLESGAAVAKAKTETPQQMMYYVETLAAGTQFYWSLTLDDVSELEFEAFLMALAEFSRMPYLGGKSNVGLGQVSVKFDKWLQIDSRIQANSEEIALPLGAQYQQFLNQYGLEIRRTLDEM